VNIDVYGVGNGLIWSENLRCTGTEQYIGDCSHNSNWRINNCAGRNTVAVSCISGKFIILCKLTGLTKLDFVVSTGPPAVMNAAVRFAMIILPRHSATCTGFRVPQRISFKLAVVRPWTWTGLINQSKHIPIAPCVASESEAQRHSVQPVARIRARQRLHSSSTSALDVSSTRDVNKDTWLEDKDQGLEFKDRNQGLST